MLLVFKLTVTPLLVGLASLAARRWGNTFAGLIAGFPLMTAPISVFLTIEQGAAFSVAATTGILIALIGVAANTFTYVLLARFAPWPVAVTGAYASFFAVSIALQPYADTLPKAAVGAFAAILIAIILIPRFRLEDAPPAIPWWEIWLRMSATAAMIATATAVAEIVGPAWTGIISTVPVIGTVMAVFTHARWGYRAVARFMRSMMLSMISFAAFFVIVALALAEFGSFATYFGATVVAVLLSPVVLRLDRSIAATLGREETDQLHSAGKQ